MKDSPRKKKSREKLVKRFAEDWEIDTSSTPTIKYKRYSGFKGWWKKFFGRKHTVFAMYWFFKHDRLNNEDSRKFYFPLKHDNIPTKGVPFKYELLSNWQINEDDLKYLYAGPLIDQHGDLLVSAETKWQQFMKKIPIITLIIGLLSGLLALVFNILRLL